MSIPYKSVNAALTDIRVIGDYLKNAEHDIIAGDFSTATSEVARIIASAASIQTHLFDAVVTSTNSPVKQDAESVKLLTARAIAYTSDGVQINGMDDRWPGGLKFAKQIVDGHYSGLGPVADFMEIIGTYSDGGAESARVNVRFDPADSKVANIKRFRNDVRAVIEDMQDAVE